MENCIAGYAESAWCGRTWLVGVEHEGRLRYNVELGPMGVTQFLGRRNSPADPVHVDAVRGVLREAGVVGGACRRWRRPPHPALAAWRRQVAFTADEEPF